MKRIKNLVLLTVSWFIDVACKANVKRHFSTNSRSFHQRQISFMQLIERYAWKLHNCKLFLNFNFQRQNIFDWFETCWLSLISFKPGGLIIWSQTNVSQSLKCIQTTKFIVNSDQVFQLRRLLLHNILSALSISHKCTWVMKFEIYAR